MDWFPRTEQEKFHKVLSEIWKPKESQREPKWNQRAPKGSQNGAKREPKGAKSEPKWSLKP